MNKKETEERARRCVDVNEKAGEIRVNKKTYSFDKVTQVTSVIFNLKKWLYYIFVFEQYNNIFIKVFGPNAGQVAVYKEVVTPIINEVLQG